MRLPLILLITLALPFAALAAEFTEYPEFRYASGLPGGGFGVTPDGHVGFDGAMQVNIPIGYTPGWSNFAVVPSVGAINGGFPDDFDGPDVNGTLMMGIGLFKNTRVWFSDMGTGNGQSLESAYNVQVQVVQEKEHFPAISVGVTDLLDQRASSLTMPFEGDGRSFFVVATKEAGTPEQPLYLTLGLGTGRFNDRPFGGVSYQPWRRVKVYGEYDGWNANIGGGYDVVRSREWHAIFSLSLIDLERVNVALAVTKTNF